MQASNDVVTTTVPSRKDRQPQPCASTGKPPVSGPTATTAVSSAVQKQQQVKDVSSPAATTVTSPTKGSADRSQPSAPQPTSVRQSSSKPLPSSGGMVENATSDRDWRAKLDKNRKSKAVAVVYFQTISSLSTLTTIIPVAMQKTLLQ